MRLPALIFTATGNRDAKRVMADCGRSLKRFQTEWLDGYFAHGGWSDGFYDWHPCAVCGQTKLTSWQAETFKDEKVWLCDDCKEGWEKQQQGET